MTPKAVVSPTPEPTEASTPTPAVTPTEAPTLSPKDQKKIELNQLIDSFLNAEGNYSDEELNNILTIKEILGVRRVMIWVY